MNKLPLALLAITTTSMAFSANMDSRVTELEKEMKDVRAETALGTYGMMTAPASPSVEDGWGWYASLSPIYQRAKIKGTEFCFTDDDPIATLPINGRTKEIDFDWDWGIKAGLGYYFEHDAWDVYLNFMYLSTNGSKSVGSGLNGSLIPLKGSASIPSACLDGSFFLFVKTAKSQFSADFHVLNLELGRNYFISKSLSLRPYWGLQSTWIDMEQVTRYTDVFNSVYIRDDDDFWGLGPRVGVNTKWFFCKGWNIFGDAAGALLYGNNDVNHHEKFSLCPDASKISINANSHQVVPTAQLIFGLGWEGYCNDMRNQFSIRAGYDVQYWWRVQQMLKIDDFEVFKYERYSEDVAVHGLTIDARISF